MISIGKGDGKFDNKPLRTEESRAEVRASGDGCGIEYDSRVTNSEAISRGLERNSSAEEDKSMSGVGEGSDVDRKMGKEESRVFEVKTEKSPSFVQFDMQTGRFGARRDDIDANEQITHGRGDAKGEVYKTLLSEFDDFVANEKHGAMEGESRALSYGFEVGDLVWGKVKSHPWWPGHIFNEAFASSSVRRTRREGFVLVAFFGDSSYGWFDPAELIPFVPHFAEKSQQTSSRNFARAVEEAMDEACRRQGLGLACRCRNRYNFRPTDVEGYFEVDVPDYEPRGVYSEIQIKKAWDAFQPGETLSFMKQTAFAPQECNQNTIEFVKNKATVFALRKAVFEEFDETYAQAFGVHSKRSANDPAKVSNQPVKLPALAPLSGPLVIAEALGGGKTSKKPVKVKDASKKDRYLIKRRDEPIASKALLIGQKQASPSSAPVKPEEGSSQAMTGEFVSAQSDGRSEITGCSGDAFGKAVISDNISGAVSSPIKENSAVPELGNRLRTDEGVGSTTTNVSEISVKGMPLGVADMASPSLRQEVNDVMDVKTEHSAKITKLNEGSQLIEKLPARSVGEAVPGKLQDASHGSRLSAPVEVVGDAVVKKLKVKKRPLEDSAHEDSIIREKKKKKKKQPDGVANPDLPKKLATKTGGAFDGATREDPHRKDVSTSNASLTATTIGRENIELEVPHLLSSLRGFALDPFHGVGRSLPVALQFFLQFRSFYFQKSLVSGTESTGSRAKSPSSVAIAQNSSGQTPSKPMKSLARNGDPTKGGQKRLPSDRQEEIAAKRLKKISQIKSLAAEKKMGTQRAELKELAPPKMVKPNSARKPTPQARVSEPTMLIMKFPPQTSLPSAAELKAKFARFGAIDQSAIRVFWATSTCRVVFRHKGDALAAHRYGAANSSLFNDLNVKYSIREVGAPASEATESDKPRGEDSSQKDPTVERQPVMHQPALQSNIQPKSILKKPLGEEAGQVTGNNNGRGTARVKFLLGGEETSNRNFNYNASFADGGGHTSVAMDFNSNNFQKVIPQSSSSSAPPILPLPAQFAKAPIVNSHHTHTPIEVAPRNMHINSASTVTTQPSVDISQPMLSLLTRCNDVVTSVVGLLGYVPYHPL